LRTGWRGEEGVRSSITEREGERFWGEWGKEEKHCRPGEKETKERIWSVSPTEVRDQREGEGDTREVIEETEERVRGERESPAFNAEFIEERESIK
jgi:hypothetical protein